MRVWPRQLLITIGIKSTTVEIARFVNPLMLLAISSDCKITLAQGGASEQREKWKNTHEKVMDVQSVISCITHLPLHVRVHICVHFCDILSHIFKIRKKNNVRWRNES